MISILSRANYQTKYLFVVHRLEKLIGLRIKYVFLVAVIHEVAGLDKISALCDSRIEGGSSHYYLYFPTIIIELSCDYSSIEDRFIFEIKEGFLQSIAALLSFRPVEEERKLLFDWLEDGCDWFVLVLRLPF